MSALGTFADGVSAVLVVGAAAAGAGPLSSTRADSSVAAMAISVAVLIAR